METVSELFRADWRTDRHNEFNSRVSQFCKRAQKTTFHFLFQIYSQDSATPILTPRTHLGVFPPTYQGNDPARVH